MFSFTMVIEEALYMQKLIVILLGNKIGKVAKGQSGFLIMGGAYRLIIIELHIHKFGMK